MLVRPWKPLVESDDPRPAGGAAGDLDGVLHGFGPGVDEHAAFGSGSGCLLVQAGGQLDIRLPGEDADGGMRETVDLRVGGSDHPRVRVADVHHADSAGEVDELPAVGVGDDGVLGGPHQRRGRADHSSRQRFGPQAIRVGAARTGAHWTGSLTGSVGAAGSAGAPAMTVQPFVSLSASSSSAAVNRGPILSSIA